MLTMLGTNVSKVIAHAQASMGVSDQCWGQGSKKVKEMPRRNIKATIKVTASFLRAFHFWGHTSSEG